MLFYQCINRSRCIDSLLAPYFPYVVCRHIDHSCFCFVNASCCFISCSLAIFTSKYFLILTFTCTVFVFFVDSEHGHSGSGGFHHQSSRSGPSGHSNYPRVFVRHVSSPCLTAAGNSFHLALPLFPFARDFIGVCYVVHVLVF